MSSGIAGESAFDKSEERTRPVFAISPAHRDDLSLRLAKLQIAAVGARRHEGISRRFLLSGACVLLVDGRDAIDASLGLLGDLVGVVRAQGAKVVVMIDRDDSARLDEFSTLALDAYLPGDCDDHEMRAVLAALSPRIAIENDAGSGGKSRYDPLDWTLDLETGDLLMGDAMREQFSPYFDDISRVSDALHMLDSETRMQAFAAYKAVKRGAPQAMFFHKAGKDSPMPEDMIHSVTCDDGMLVGSVLPAAEQIAAHGNYSQHDMLTGLPAEASALALLDARLATGPASVLLIELTDLDRINDQAGESSGDELLRAVAGQIDRFARDEWGVEAVVARIKGTRFALIASPDTTIDQLRAERQSLAETLATPVMLSGTSWQVGIQTGVASAGQGTTAKSLLRDAALALAKEDDSTLPLDIGEAIKGGQVRVVYQPQYRIVDDRIIGVEALTRWDHPELGRLGAAPLVTAARRAGVLPELTAHIHDIALEDMTNWPQHLDAIRLSLNITAEDIARSGFAQRFLDRLRHWSVDPARITVEVTEDAMVADIGHAADVLVELKAAGVGIAIDDFGAGYAGIGYLRDLPLDYLKIDSGMTNNMIGNERDQMMIHAVFELAKSLGLETVAEGVETPEQLAILAGEGCSSYQGFLRSDAVTSERLAEIA